MFVIGVTGGIGSGKSTVARILGEWGIPVIDADKMCIRDRTLPDPGDSPLDLLESAEVIAAVREAALALKEPYRTTLIEIDLLQHSYEEVSEKLDVPLGTIKSRLSRARKMAADILKKRLGTK